MRTDLQINLTEAEATTLRDALGDGETSATVLTAGDGHGGYGLYAFSEEYPEEGAVLVTNIPPLPPAFRGYAELGAGQYLLNNSAKGEPVELIISIATEEEKAGRVVGDHRDNPDGHILQPEAMAVRLRFASVAGLDALESQLRMLREEHFPESVRAA